MFSSLEGILYEHDYFIFDLLAMSQSSIDYLLKMVVNVKCS